MAGAAMTDILYGVFGTGGCARGVMPTARAMLAEQGVDLAQLVFVDDFNPSTSCNGHAVLTYRDFLAYSGNKLASIAIADGRTRQRIATECASDGVGFFDTRASQIALMDDVEIGEGAIISPFVAITSNVRIGRHFQANLYSYVEHDCVVGDFVTLAPGAKCNGNVVIEDLAYIGSDATIKQGKPGNPLVIGRGAVVGMGAVVTRSVPPGATVVGNPARLHNPERN